MFLQFYFCRLLCSSYLHPALCSCPFLFQYYWSVINCWLLYSSDETIPCIIYGSFRAERCIFVRQILTCRKLVRFCAKFLPRRWALVTELVKRSDLRFLFHPPPFRPRIYDPAVSLICPEVRYRYLRASDYVVSLKIASMLASFMFRGNLQFEVPRRLHVPFFTSIV